MTSSNLRRLAAAFLLFGAVACGRSSLAGIEITTLDGLRVSGLETPLAPGEARAFQVTGLYSDGSESDVTRDANTAYVVSPETVATVGEAGVLTALAAGPGVLVVSHGGKTAEAVFEVLPEEDVVLDVRLDVDGAVRLDVGETTQFRLVALFSSGAFEDVTGSPETTWTSDAPDFATVDASGLVTAVSAGVAVIRGEFQGFSASAGVTVNGDPVVSIEVLPAEASLVVGESVALTVLARTQLGATLDVTADAATTYASGDETVATVDATGLVTGAGEGGPVPVTVKHAGFETTMAVAVRAVVGVPVSLRVVPPSVDVRPGESVPLQVFAVYADGAEVDVTADPGTTYSAMNGRVVSVDAAGVVSGVTAGVAEVVVTSGALTVTVEVRVASAPRVLAELLVEPLELQGIEGDSVQLEVTGVYSDGATGDVTAAATGTTYESSDAAVAVVTADGLVRFVGEGTAAVTVRNGRMTTTVDVEVEALPAVVVSLRVAPTTVSVQAGATVPLAVFAVYSDGSEVDVTAAPETSYRAEPVALATVSATGLLTGGEVGSGRVIAGNSGFSASVDVEVTAPPVVLVALSAAPSPLTLEPGASQALTITGTYSDASTRDLTDGSTGTSYTSLDPLVATVDATGRVTAAGPGTTTIRAENAGLFVEISTTVTAPPPTLVLLSVSPDRATVTLRGTQALTVTGTYSDGSTRDLTNGSTGTTYGTSSTTIATVDANGVVTAVGPGDALIRAENVGVSVTATITVPVPPPTLVSLAVSPVTATVAIGATQQLTVTGTYSDGSTRDLTGASTGTTYTSGAATIASVDATGLVTARAAGSAVIRVENAGISATSSITVPAPPVVLVSIAITPATASLNVGARQPLVVTGTYSDGSTRNLTAASTGTTYTSSAPTIASVDASGVVTARAVGPATIQATNAGISGTSSITVAAAPPTLVSISATPESASVAIGGTQQLTVTGTYSDGSTRNLTAGSTGTTYSTGSLTVVFVTVSADGLVTGVAAGNVTVTVRNGSATDTVAITVPAPRTLVSIAVSPATATVGLNATQALTVTGTYSDGSTADLTSAASGTTYASSSATVATVDAAGTVTGRAAGNATITASNAGKTATSVITVPATPRTLVSITVTPVNATVAVNATQQLTVTGNWSDSTTSDLTAASTGTTYSSASATIATVSAGGLVTARGAGTTTITVTNTGKTASFTITVPAPRTLVSISATPASLNLAVGATQPLVVTGTYSDGSTADLTAASSGTTYATGPATVVIVTVTADGLVRATAPGSTTITVRNSGQTDTVAVTVPSPRTLQSIAVAPATATLALGATQQLTVTGTYSDGSTADLTSAAGTQYTSSAATIASVSAAGLVTARAPGNATIRVTVGLFTATSTITVPSPRTLVSIAITPATATIAVGGTQQFTVTGTYSDGTTADLTNASAGTTYTASTGGVVSITANGLATALGAGSTTITATNGIRTATANVTVPAPRTLVSIAITPATIPLSTGATQQLTVTGTYSDGTTADLTSATSGTRYASSPAGIVSTGSNGLVTALAAGSTTVTATNAGNTATATVTVTAPPVTLVSLAITPPNSRVNHPATQQLVVTATYSDGSTAPVTNDPGIAYTSSNTLVATVNATGLVTSVGAGTTVIRATLSGVSATANILVTNLVSPVVAITVSPNPGTVQRGSTLSLTVTGIRQNGQTVDLTTDPGTTYNSSVSSVATVSSTGLVTGVAAGTSTVTVGYLALTASTAITVTAPTLTSLTVTPDPVAVGQGATATVTVTAGYSDGSSVDVTADPTTVYVSGNPTLMTVAAGTVTGVGPGSTQLIVVYGGRSAVVTVSVARRLTGLTVAPATTTVFVGATRALVATATYSDGTTATVTTDAGTAWSTSSGTIATVSAGTVTGAGPGTATITATFGGFSATSSVTVSYAQPAITGLTPPHVLTGAGAVLVRVIGLNFPANAQVSFDGAATSTTFISSTEVQFTVPATATASAGSHTVRVTSATAGINPSNTVAFWVVASPVTVSSLYPSAGVKGTRLDVTIVGTGLGGATVTIANPAISVGSTTYSADGTKLFTSFTIASGATLGATTVTVSNSLPSSGTATFTVLDPATCTDLVVAAGQTVTLSGTQLRCNITIDTGARVIASGLQPLALLATGNIVVRGKIEANGVDGVAGFSNPAGGGAAGPGGGGGGGGGDGSASSPALGGAGSPAGQNGSINSGAGTRSGNGGGNGAGQGISGGCGQGGGGGALGGNGGNGGGDAGVGRGGVGGTANPEGSTYGGGTGGGGGSTCGGNSGGGGGGGGGVVRLVATTGGTILVDGAIEANGGSGGCGFTGTGNGGGGSGGLIEVISEGGRITISDTLRAKGGNSCDGSPTSGDGGGGGGGGRIVVDANGGGVTEVDGFYDVAGGLSFPSLTGSNSGTNGSTGEVVVTP